ncbi:hypothetical protein D3C87_1292340 [compost metagenome]
MRIPKKQDRTLLFICFISIMNLALSCCQADFIKFFPAIGSRILAIIFNLKGFKPFKFQFIIKLRNDAYYFLLHSAKLRNSNLCSSYFFG